MRNMVAMMTALVRMAAVVTVNARTHARTCGRVRLHTRAIHENATRYWIG